MIYLKTFKLSESRNTDPNIYPFCIFKNKEPNIFVFDDITVLYGNNGSGKSTILNMIAHKLNLKGKERNYSRIDGWWPYFENYSNECKYEIRKIQQDAVLQESIESTLTKERGRQNAKDFLKTKEGGKQFPRFAFAQDKYSNGETTLQILEEDIEPDKLYLLDEPEVSLSPQNQVKLAEKINEMARYLGVQFVIATHSPFMLGILNAKIYNLDTKDYRVEKWNELENVRYFYNFFKSKKKEFEN